MAQPHGSQIRKLGFEGHCDEVRHIGIIRSQHALHLCQGSPILSKFGFRRVLRTVWRIAIVEKLRDEDQVRVQDRFEMSAIKCVTPFSVSEPLPHRRDAAAAEGSMRIKHGFPSPMSNFTPLKYELQTRLFGPARL
jgi:hypothetical protein